MKRYETVLVNSDRTAITETDEKGTRIIGHMLSNKPGGEAVDPFASAEELKRIEEQNRDNTPSL